RRMTSDLDFGIEVVGLPTVREADGLAMSSRNRRLTPEQRSAAVVVPRILDAVAAATEHRSVTTADLVAIATEVAAAEPLARFEHLDVVDAEILEHLTVVDGSRPAVALTAVWFGEVRLIDNRRL
ncbi:MAG: pantothenate synthetase, partial [Actinomycetota bacterium]